MTLKNYWQSPKDVQNNIKDSNPETPLKVWRVVGRLNIQYRNKNNFPTATGLPINDTFRAYTKADAIKLAVNSMRPYYPEDASFGWLNDGPKVTEVIPESET